MGNGNSKQSVALKKYAGGKSVADFQRQLNFAIEQKYGINIGSVGAFQLDAQKLQDVLEIDKEMALLLIRLVKSSHSTDSVLVTSDAELAEDDQNVTVNQMSCIVALLCKGDFAEKVKLLFEFFNSNTLDDGDIPALDEKELFELVRFSISLAEALRKESKLEETQSEKQEDTPASDTAKGKEELSSSRIESIRQEAENLVKQILKEADTNNDGKIDAIEFSSYAQDSPLLSKMLLNIEDLLSPYTPLKKYPKDPKDKTFRILSLDGGGVKGSVTIQVLQKLEKQFPGFIDSVDFFAGTSTGAIIASMLAIGTPLDKLEDMYDESCAVIFSHSKGVTGQIMDSKYSNANFEKVALNAAGYLRLGDVKKKLLVPTFSLKNTHLLDSDKQEKFSALHWGPVIYHNFRKLPEGLVQTSENTLSRFSLGAEEVGPGNQGDDEVSEFDNEYLYQMVLKSASAPVYFPPYEGLYMDGGIFANNPSSAALVQAMHTRYEERQEAKNIRMLSLGTGVFPVTKDSIRGVTDISAVFDMFMEGGTQFSYGVCSGILGSNFHRFQPYLPFQTSLDDFGKISQLKLAAQSLNFNSLNNWVSQRWFNGEPPSSDAKVQYPIGAMGRAATPLTSVESVHGKKIGLEKGAVDLSWLMAEASPEGLLLDIIRLNDIPLEGEPATYTAQLAIDKWFRKGITGFLTVLADDLVLAQQFTGDKKFAVAIIFDLANVPITVDQFKEAFMAVLKVLKHLDSNISKRYQDCITFEDVVNRELKNTNMPNLPPNIYFGMDITASEQSTSASYPQHADPWVTMGWDEPTDVHSCVISYVLGRDASIRWHGDAGAIGRKHTAMINVALLEPVVQDPKEVARLEAAYRKFRLETIKNKEEQLKKRDQAMTKLEEMKAKKEMQEMKRKGLWVKDMKKRVQSSHAKLAKKMDAKKQSLFSSTAKFLRRGMSEDQEKMYNGNANAAGSGSLPNSPVVSRNK